MEAISWWLKKAKKNARIAILESGRVKQVYDAQSTIDCTVDQIIVNNVNICEALNKILSSYDHLVEQYELEQRAKALEIVEIFVPKLPSEWEQLVYNISTIVLESRLVRTFYIYQDDKEVVLGIYCYENGYYRECEQTLEKAVEDLVSHRYYFRSVLLSSVLVFGGYSDMPGKRYTIFH